MIGPAQTCQTEGCSRQGQSIAGKRQEYSAYLFTRHWGILPVRVVTQYCKGILFSSLTSVCIFLQYDMSPNNKFLIWNPFPVHQETWLHESIISVSLYKIPARVLVERWSGMLFTSMHSSRTPKGAMRISSCRTMGHKTSILLRHFVNAINT